MTHLQLENNFFKQVLAYFFIRKKRIINSQFLEFSNFYFNKIKIKFVLKEWSYLIV